MLSCMGVRAAEAREARRSTCCRLPGLITAQPPWCVFIEKVSIVAWRVWSKGARPERIPRVPTRRRAIFLLCHDGHSVEGWARSDTCTAPRFGLPQSAAHSKPPLRALSIGPSRRRRCCCCCFRSEVARLSSVRLVRGSSEPRRRPTSGATSTVTLARETSEATGGARDLCGAVLVAVHYSVVVIV